MGGYEKIESNESNVAFRLSPTLSIITTIFGFDTRPMMTEANKSIRKAIIEYNWHWLNISNFNNDL